MLRSAVAIAAGYLVMAAAIMVLFALWFRTPDQTPSVGFMLFAVAYGFAFAIVGGYVAAAIAGRAPLSHAVALAILSAGLGLVSLFTPGGKEPLWFLAANAVAMVAGVLLGGHLRSRRGPAPAVPPRA